jgi:Nuclease-related domain
VAQRKLLKLRRDDTCATCNRPLPAGTEAYWLKADREVMCRPCGDRRPIAASVAGASADREYTRRRQARIDRQAARLGRVGKWAAEMSNGPQHEQAWARGAAGERRNALRLEKLVAGHPIAFLHDRLVPGSRANIDHIAIGPPGVVVVDSKNAQGAVKVDWEGGLFSERRWFLYVGGRDRTSWVESVERQVELVRTILAAAGYSDVPVAGALCMANAEGLPWIGHPRLREIAICRPRHVAKRLTAAGPLTVDAIRSVQSALDRVLLPA